MTCHFRFLFDSALRSGKLCVAVLRKTKRRAPAPPPSQQQQSASHQPRRENTTTPSSSNAATEQTTTGAGNNMDKNGQFATLPRIGMQLQDQQQSPNGFNNTKGQQGLSASSNDLAETQQGGDAEKSAAAAKGRVADLASPVTVARSDSVLSKMLPEVKRKVGNCTTRLYPIHLTLCSDVIV